MQTYMSRSAELRSRAAEATASPMYRSRRDGVTGPFATSALFPNSRSQLRSVAEPTTAALRLSYL